MSDEVQQSMDGDQFLKLINSMSQTIVAALESNQAEHRVMMATLQEHKEAMHAFQKQFKEVQEELSGDRNTPALHYRVTQLEKWRCDKEENAKQMKKTTLETVIKTIVPWVLTTILFGLLMWFGLNPPQ